MQTKQFLLLSVVIVLMMSCIQGQQQSSKSEESKKILIVYYSWSGNTKEVAQQIQKTTGGDIFEIVPIEAYPVNYQECIDQAKEEINAGFKPALQSKVEDIESYDIIFVGTPNWWSTIAPPVVTFLSEYNLEGKTIVPFCTHGNGGKARCFSDMAEHCLKSTFIENGFAISGNSAKSAQNEVDQWLQEIKIIN